MYEKAARLAKLAENGQSYKTALYSIKNKKIVKSVHFLVGNAVRRRELIDQLLTRVGLMEQIEGDGWLARVAIVELLWGHCRLPNSTPLFRKIIRFKHKLLKILPAVEKETVSKEDLDIPRYIRLNTEVLTKDSAVLRLKELGFVLLQTPPNYAEFLASVKNLKEKEFIFDFNVPNLIVFHRKAKIADLSPVSYIRQDKSSCLVGLVLAPVAGATILDLCAAPGYKSQHAASLIYKMGTVYSVDINRERYKTLEDTCKKFGLKGICHPMNMDALKVTEAICPNVEYIIVDPPCSGTGIVNILMKHSADKERLRKLSNLQAMILKHALSDFPCARRIVYSTCSIEEEENELVVSECLPVAEENGFKLVPLGGVLRGSFRTGNGSSSVASSVLRMSPENDLTNGFFIALFERSLPPKIPSGKTTSETVCTLENHKAQTMEESISSSNEDSSNEDEQNKGSRISKDDEKDTTTEKKLLKGKIIKKIKKRLINKAQETSKILNDEEKNFTNKKFDIKNTCSGDEKHVIKKNLKQVPNKNHLLKQINSQSIIRKKIRSKLKPLQSRRRKGIK